MKKKTIEANFFYGANPDTFHKARLLRQNMTNAEKQFWQYLRKPPFKSWHFRRQHPVNQFIVDFYCDKAKLVIELDGSIHGLAEVKERDEGREFFLKQLGLEVIRFSNDAVFQTPDLVLQQVSVFLATITETKKTCDTSITLTPLSCFRLYRVFSPSPKWEGELLFRALELSIMKVEQTNNLIFKAILSKSRRNVLPLLPFWGRGEVRCNQQHDKEIGRAHV